ncbi:hypothetical protein SAMN04487897_102235 [Paenibacillus sp. yr247]|nr:hypothetical protein SAMN04487897_102235 [Paenibacillus sp. yr247]
MDNSAHFYIFALNKAVLLFVIPKKIKNAEILRPQTFYFRN